MDYKKKMLKSLQELVAIDSVKADPEEGAPFGKGARQALDYFLNLAKELGFETTNVDGYAGNVDFKGKTDELFGILAHLDVVPFGEGWTRNPLGELVGDTLYGRGTQDDKGPAIVILYALKELKDRGFVPNKTIRLIVGCDEESGWADIAYYTKKYKMPSIGFSPDADFPIINREKGIVHFTFSGDFPNSNISLEAGSRPNIVPNKAYLTLDGKHNFDGFECTFNNDKTVVFAEGISAHGSLPQEGDNAAHKLLKLLKEIDPSLSFYYDTFASIDGSGLNIKMSDEVSGNLTSNLGVINIKDGKFNAVVDIRYPVTKDFEEIKERINKIIDGKCVIADYYHQKPLYVPDNHPLIKNLLDAYEEVTGLKGYTVAIGGGTYSRALPVAVGFGPIFLDEEATIHQKDERVKISNLNKLYDVYIKAIINCTK